MSDRALTQATAELICNTPPKLFIRSIECPMRTPFASIAKPGRGAVGFRVVYIIPKGIFWLYDFGNETIGVLEHTHDWK